MPRSMWNGTVGFGLVNVPVELVPATRDLDYRFRELHGKDGSPVRHVRVRKDDGSELEWDQVGRGYETDDGEMVIVSDEDLESAAPEKSRTIEIETFVPLEQVDPVSLNSSYYLLPRDRNKGTLRAYGLLVRAMAGRDLGAIGRFVMRSHEYLALIRERENALALTTLFFPDEVRSPDDVPATDFEVKEEAVENAVAVVRERSLDWDPERYDDCYRERLKRVIESKRRGETVRAPEPAADQEASPAPDLMAALEKTLAESRKRGRGTDETSQKGDLSQLSREELYKRAKKRGVKGRSSMNKRELMSVLRKR
jgi:DNA end-binding protein Ku